MTTEDVTDQSTKPAAQKWRRWGDRVAAKIANHKAIFAAHPDGPSDVKGGHMRKGNSDPLPLDMAAELAALEVMPDKTIDTLDIPAVEDWSDAQRGRFYKQK